MSDTSYKTFLAPNNIGISTYGVADIAGVPIAGYVEAFIREKLAEDTAADDVPPKLLEYFREFPTPPLTYFLVAGYQTEEGRREQRVWSVDVPANTVQRLDSDLPEGGGAMGRREGHSYATDEFDSGRRYCWNRGRDRAFIWHTLSVFHPPRRD
jgi:hypothetical protein